MLHWVDLLICSAMYSVLYLPVEHASWLLCVYNAQTQAVSNNFHLHVSAKFIDVLWTDVCYYKVMHEVWICLVIILIIPSLPLVFKWFRCSCWFWLVHIHWCSLWLHTTYAKRSVSLVQNVPTPVTMLLDWDWGLLAWDIHWQQEADCFNWLIL